MIKDGLHKMIQKEGVKKRFPERMYATRLPDALKQIMMLFLFLGAGCVVILIMWYAYFDTLSSTPAKVIQKSSKVSFDETGQLFDELPSGIDVGEDFIVTMEEGRTDIARLYAEVKND